MACTVASGRIVDVVALLDPIRLAAMDLPAARRGVGHGSPTAIDIMCCLPAR
jgi:hypothetical protein